MKFGKSLSNQIEETLPDWRDKFLSYKELKKLLKRIDPTPEGSSSAGGGNGYAIDRRPAKRRRITSTGADGDGTVVVMVEDGMTKEEHGFINLLENELDKFNSFFVEKEEEYIIRLKELQERVTNAKESNKEMFKIRKEIVDFHGEMVLLENYSALNYTGLVKILKKYDKRTGALIRLPFIQRVLQQPFFTTDLLYKLVKECERMLDLLFPTTEPSAEQRIDGEEQSEPTTSNSTERIGGIQIKSPKELSEIEYMESLYMKSTISALKALKEIRSKSSTVSVFSLPPLQLSGLEETWKKIPVLEQAAK